MKNLSIAMVMLVLIFSGSACAQIRLNQVIKSGSSGQDKGLSNDKIIKGLKEALSRGADLASGRASQSDGFYRNPLIKIPFPQEARQMEQTLRSVGMSKQVDDFIRTLNRAAEEAAKKAAPVFIGAITRMTVNDGLGILRGGDHAATNFLKGATSSALAGEFRPVVKEALQKVEITRYWSPLVKKYNQIPMVKRMNPDLEAYVTDRAISGLFSLIAEEEAKIRKDPAATANALIQEVFGKK